MKNPFSRQHEQHGSDVTRDVLWQNEIEANRLTTIFMCVCALFMVLCMALTFAGVFTENAHKVYAAFIEAMICHLLPCLVSFRVRYARPWLKYLLLAGLILGQARVDCGLGFNVTLSILLPVVFSTRYYSRRLTVTVSAITTLVFAVSTYIGASTGFTPVDRNILLDPARYVRDIMVTSFFPKWLLFALISGVCTEIAHRGREMVEAQAVISQAHGRVETELQTAAQIQLRALPEAGRLCAGRQVPFELATSILPAREVGGDFYDFFYVDPTHLALIIADVSGKGVPAALFMMISKILLDTSAASGSTPGKVLSTVNHQLCEKNINDMFVTVWLGILDLTTGELVSANAGHENPIVCRGDGSVEVIRSKHGMVLGGIDGVRYQDDTVHLASGDTLFVYTDGIPEAQDQHQKMYGMDRLVRALTASQGLPPQELVNAVQQDVNRFAGDAPQFDDSTMLALRMTGLMKRDGLQLRPDQASIVTAQEYVARQMEQAGVPAKQAARMNIAMDEMYSNIVHYSGAGWAEVMCSVEDGCITLRLQDNGTPYDPLKTAEPELSQSAGERRVGGLGVFMTRRMMDGMSYRYADGCNEITLTLKYDAGSPAEDRK